MLGGPTITETGFAYAFVPLGLNALILVATGFLFHRLSGQHWPLRSTQSATQPVGARRFTPEDIAGAVDDMGTAVDISREDLETLIRRIEARAASRLARESRQTGVQANRLRAGREEGAALEQSRGAWGGTWKGFDNHHERHYELTVTMLVTSHESRLSQSYQADDEHGCRSRGVRS